MEFEAIDKLVGHEWGISSENARTIYDFIIQSNIATILELGFARGKSTSYMAAALARNGVGRITTIDLRDPRRKYIGHPLDLLGVEKGFIWFGKREPSIIRLLKLAKLDHYVNVVFAESSYNWELMKMIEENSEQGQCRPVFDFCYIDGAHSWEVDGLVFFLVEKLLKPGGWILFEVLPA